MRQLGEWGEYFPARVSPFSYNESMAQDYFPLTKKEALERGYKWYDRPIPDYKIILKSDNLPKTIQKTKNDILEQVIACRTQSENEKENRPECTRAFRLTQLEFALYQKIGIPVPEYCFACRRVRRFKLRNPRKLWHRECMKKGCQNKFETSYSPERSEIIYCEHCYQQEVY
jgi:hypothetical protein